MAGFDKNNVIFIIGLKEKVLQMKGIVRLLN
jgi:hypothetical protein